MHVGLCAEILRIGVGRRRVDYLCRFSVWTLESVNAQMRDFANGELVNIALRQMWNVECDPKFV